jgi:starch-binding outer membrane protein SusE/F
MKNKFLFLIASILMLGIWSCEKDQNQVFVEGGTPPVLTASVTGTIPLSFATRNNQAVRLNWTAPNYELTTGPNSLDLSYNIEIDTLGANFNSPRKKVIAVSRDLTYTMTEGELNDYLLNTLSLDTSKNYNIQMRVKSFLPNNNSPLTSNVLTFAVKTFPIPPKVAPPVNLFIVGDATAGGWANPVPVPSQQLTKVSPTLFRITMPLVGGKSYLLLPVNGDWSAKFGGVGAANNSNNPSADEFKAGGSDLLAPPTSGTYTLTFDFQKGTYTVQ